MPSAPGRGRVGRLLLTGTYNSFNKGDAAMELAAAQAIGRLCPGCEITILAPFPEIDAAFYAPLRVARCNRRQLLRASFTLLRASTWRTLRSIGVEADWLLDQSLRRVLESDLVVDLSGDMLTEDYGLHVAYSHYIPLLRALILGRPYFICAQSIGPFRITRPLARLLLARAAAVTTRDPISCDYLASLGIAGDRVEQTADLAFLLDPAPAARAEAILLDEGVRLDGRLVLGVSISRLIESHFLKRNRRAAGRDFLGLMKEVIERAAREHDAQVLIVSHVTGPSRAKDDRRIAAELMARLDPGIGAFALAGDYRPEELKALVARCSVFLGARMHANIAALSSCIPTVALSYSHKTPGIMASCGMREFVVPIASADPEALGGLLMRAFRERHDLTSRLQRQLPAVRDLALRNLQIIDELQATRRDRA